MSTAFIKVMSREIEGVHAGEDQVALLYFGLALATT